MSWRDHCRDRLHRLEFWVFHNLTHQIKQRRMNLFFSALKPVAGERVLDLGAGGDSFWRDFAGAHGAVLAELRLTALDVRPLNGLRSYADQVIGDGRRLPFRSGAFAIVFSNSVIEHVGDHEQQRLMAAEIQRVGRRYFVQVPARCFPIEAHYFLPFMAYLPARWRVAITRCLFGVSEPIFLPSLRQVRELFPQATVVKERLGGLTKSFLIYGDCTSCRSAADRV